MRIGNGPKRFGGPSQKFLSKKKGLDQQGRPVAGEKPPKDGPVRIFLDDERALPKGWTLARGPGEFMKLLDEVAPGRIVAISLDWHLGTGVANGEDVARRLIGRMRDRPELFSNLEIIWLHSSDRQKAIAMMHTVETPLQEDWEGLPFYTTALGLPDIHGRDIEKSDARSRAEQGHAW